MVRPLYLQDNFGKTMVTHEVFDRMTEGAAKMRNQELAAMMQEMERKQKELATVLDKKEETKSIRDERPDQRQKQKRRRRSQSDRNNNEQEEFEDEHEQELRLRKPEDDDGKGGKIDIKG